MRKFFLNKLVRDTNKLMLNMMLCNTASKNEANHMQGIQAQKGRKLTLQEFNIKKPKVKIVFTQDSCSFTVPLKMLEMFV